MAACLLGTVGLAATGTLYGALSAGLRVRETLLPFLLLPMRAPSCWPAPGSGRPSSAGHRASGTQWLRLLVVFAAVYLAVGVVVYGPMQEAA